VNHNLNTGHLQTPHLPPCFAQWEQYLQSLQALHGSLPVHVAKEVSAVIIVITAKRPPVAKLETVAAFLVSISDGQNSTPLSRLLSSNADVNADTAVMASR
jgi:hypothetical protein